MKYMKLSFLYPLIFIVLAILILYFGYKNLFTKSSFTNLKSLGNKTFKASSKYADIEYNTSDDAQTLYITVHYKDLTNVSAIHIHTNNNGSPGPILAWLGTSKEWQQGVAQNTPGGNSPCGSDNNPLSTLAAPQGTPYINNLANSTRTFTVTNKTSKLCPWIGNGTVVCCHGFNFQKVINGQLTNEKPGADMISNNLFEIK